jgi:hypothetical protein
VGVHERDGSFRATFGGLLLGRFTSAAKAARRYDAALRAAGGPKNSKQRYNFDGGGEDTTLQQYGGGDLPKRHQCGHCGRGFSDLRRLLDHLGKGDRKPGVWAAAASPECAQKAEAAEAAAAEAADEAAEAAAHRPVPATAAPGAGRSILRKLCMERQAAEKREQERERGAHAAPRHQPQPWHPEQTIESLMLADLQREASAAASVAAAAAAGLAGIGSAGSDSPTAQHARQLADQQQAAEAAAKGAAAAAGWVVGRAVLPRFPGGSPGAVTGVHEDGAVDIDYGAGGCEYAVPPHMAERQVEVVHPTDCCTDCMVALDLEVHLPSDAMVEHIAQNPPVASCAFGEAGEIEQASFITPSEVDKLKEEKSTIRYRRMEVTGYIAWCARRFGLPTPAGTLRIGNPSVAPQVGFAAHRNTARYCTPLTAATPCPPPLLLRR